MRVEEALNLVKELGPEFKVTHTKGVNGYSIKKIKMVERTNLMSGKTYMEDEDTPLYMSPAAESYWSM